MSTLCRLLRLNLWWTGAGCRLCHCPERRNRGPYGGEDRRGRRAIRHSTRNPSTTDCKARRSTSFRSTKGLPSPRRSCSTKDRSRMGHSTKVCDRTIRRSTTGWLPSRLNCRTDGSSCTRMWRTTAGMPPRRSSCHCHRDRPMSYLCRHRGLSWRSCSRG